MSDATTGIITVASTGWLAAAAVLRVGPLRLLGRNIDTVRAAGYWVVIAAQAAWSRRDRWAECVNRARGER